MHIIFKKPVLPVPPIIEDARIELWMRDLIKELYVAFSSLDDVLHHGLLDAQHIEQLLAAGFTINPDAFFIEVSSAGAVTSDATQAIKAGRNGQWVVIHNVGTQNIIIKHGANTILNQDVDLTLSPNKCIPLRYYSPNWIQAARQTV